MVVQPPNPGHRAKKSLRRPSSTLRAEMMRGEPGSCSNPDSLGGPPGPCGEVVTACHKCPASHGVVGKLAISVGVSLVFQSRESAKARVFRGALLPAIRAKPR